MAAPAAAAAAALGIGDDDDSEIYTSDDWAQFFKFKKGRDSPSEARNVLLVIAVLITTATYQSVLSPPGGLWQETKAANGTDLGHKAGKSVLSSNGYEFPFVIFIFANASGFFGSIFMIMILTEGFPLRLELGFTLIVLLLSYESAMLGILPLDEPITFVYICLCTALPSIFGFVTGKLRKSRSLRRCFGA